MFSRSHSHPSARWLVGIALGLCAIGAGPAIAQDRGDRGGAARSVDRPTQERPPMPRPAPDRPAPDRSTMGRPFGDPQATRPVGPWQDGRTSTSERPRLKPDTNAIIEPQARERVTTQPEPKYWKNRDIWAEVQAMARRGFIAVRPVGEDIQEFTGVSEFPAGWTSYGFRVPPGEKLHVRLTHPNEGWFRLIMVGKWGDMEKGMLQNVIPTGNPEVSYTNPTKSPRNVYVIVDDPGWMSVHGDPFNMKVTRSWDPAKVRLDQVPFTTGIWAQKKAETKETPAVTKEARAEEKAQPQG